MQENSTPLGVLRKKFLDGSLRLMKNPTEIIEPAVLVEVVGPGICLIFGNDEAESLASVKASRAFFGNSTLIDWR